MNLTRGNVVRTEVPTDSGPIITRFEYADPINPDKETKKILAVVGVDQITQYGYDARGNQTLLITPQGARTETTYTADDKVKSVKDPRGMITTYNYDARGNLTTVTNAEGWSSFLVFRYDANGNMIELRDPLSAALSTLTRCDGKLFFLGGVGHSRFLFSPRFGALAGLSAFSFSTSCRKEGERLAIKLSMSRT